MIAERIVAELYTAKECSLCQEMKSMLGRVRGEYPLTIREIDIESDPLLQARFAHEVPVLYLDGRKAFKYRAKEAALRRKLMLLLWRRRLFGAVMKEAE
ncbi:MAG: glutaredoxin family protein [candidate division NC10 bacterium]|nr:glutaredoxin family protein [candidate division NC10 bacterium]